jgi:hypothetical protein
MSIQFTRAIFQSGDYGPIRIISTCRSCGSSAVVSTADETIFDWELGHTCSIAGGAEISGFAIA